MKLLVIGLDGAVQEILFGDDRLANFRRLMELGCNGRLASVVPATAVPAWMCMAASQDPGSLGVYGSRMRVDHSYADLRLVGSNFAESAAIWDHLARAGKRSIIVEMPLSSLPCGVNGIYTVEVSGEVTRVAGDYLADVASLREDDRNGLKDQAYCASRKQFDLVRRFLQSADWDYFQFVEIGLDRIQRGFWQYHDPGHTLFEPGNPFANAIGDYYLYLDDQIGTVLELLTDETVVLIVSPYGVPRSDGAFGINAWLVKEGLLAFAEYPQQVAPFGQTKIDWGKTTAWSGGEDDTQVFLNVKGREPDGIVARADYEQVRDEIKAKLEAARGEDGRPLGIRVFKPEEIYRQVRGIAPDLLVHFGRMAGSFILAAPGLTRQGEVQDAHLLDIAPTLLKLGGYDIPTSLQGKSLVSGLTRDTSEETGLSQEDEEILRERLSGLGYI